MTTNKNAGGSGDATGGGFHDLGLDDRLLQTLAGLGYEEPTPIQRAAIPAILSGRNLIGQAATGTGKTAAFSLPLVQKIAARGKNQGRPSALVLVPTRELAMQVAEALHGYGQRHGIKVLAIYGGQPYETQIRALKRGVDVVIATPGRALDHIQRGTLDLARVADVVLDEADEMLDMGFIEDIEAILATTSTERQVVLFSATLPPRIAGVAKRYMKEPQKITIAPEKVKAGLMPRITQRAYIVGRSQKRLALSRLLDVEDPDAAIIFCRTRHEVDELTETLNAHGRGAEPLHGGMSQAQRERVLRKLRDEKADIVIATDVAARGLDIDHLTHVINFDLPSAPEAYVHRIGRVGRAGREGVALTLAEPREHRLLRNIEQITKQKIDIAKIPSVADLKARRLEQTESALREALAAGELDAFQSIISSLAEDHDVMEIALAAIKLVHQASGRGDVDENIEIQAPVPRGPKFERPRREAHSDRPMTRLYIDAGRQSGIRPQDLVGAITGESGIGGRQIGTIEIEERFAIVDVDESVAQTVIQAMGKAKLKGKNVTCRLWNDARQTTRKTRSPKRRS